MLMWQLMWREQKSMSPCGSVWTRHVARAFVYVRVGVFVRMSVISEIEHYFHSLRYHLLLIYPLDFLSLCHVGLLFGFYMCRWRGIMWSVRLRDLIAIIDRHLSDGVHGAL